MIVTNEDAIRAGYANIQSYRLAVRAEAAREVEQETVRQRAQIARQRERQRIASKDGPSRMYVAAHELRKRIDERGPGDNG